MTRQLTIHADWSRHPSKRWQCEATHEGRSILIEAPRQIADAGNWFAGLLANAESGERILVGFDFPIGLPIRYARRAGLDSFLDALPRFGNGEWQDSYTPAVTAAEISLLRPFYPQRPGGTRFAHVLAGLGASERTELLRQCERRSPQVPRDACPLFWTLGPNQVGKGAISGWQEIISPAIRDHRSQVAIWPFDGLLQDLLETRAIVLCETYPGAYYQHFITDSMVRGGKRAQQWRQARGPAMRRFAIALGATLSPELDATIAYGFGPEPSGEDAFDAAMGLLVMLSVRLGKMTAGEPQAQHIRRTEGWILGLDYGAPL